MNIVSPKFIVHCYEATGYKPISNGWGGVIDGVTYACPTQVIIARRRFLEGKSEAHEPPRTLTYEDLTMELGWNLSYLDQFLETWDGQDGCVQDHPNVASLLDQADRAAGQAYIKLSPVPMWSELASRAESEGKHVTCWACMDHIDGCECTDQRPMFSVFD